MMHLCTVPGEQEKAVVTDHFLLVTHGLLAVEPFNKFKEQKSFLILFMEHVSASSLG